MHCPSAKIAVTYPGQCLAGAALQQQDRLFTVRATTQQMFARVVHIDAQKDRESYNLPLVSAKDAQTDARTGRAATKHTCLQGVLKLMHWLVVSWHLWRGVGGSRQAISAPHKARDQRAFLFAMLLGVDCQRGRPCCCYPVGLLWLLPPA